MERYIGTGFSKGQNAVRAAHPNAVDLREQAPSPEGEGWVEGI